MTKRLRAAIYTRVSTKDQNTGRQKEKLLQMAEVRDWDVVGVYDDTASGTNGRDGRPELDRLLDDATRREFDVVACWALDRLGRSVYHLSQIAEHLRQRKVAMYFHEQGIDTTTEAGRMFYGIMASVAQFENEERKRRQRSGIEYAKKHGTKSGKPIGRQRKRNGYRDKVLGLREQGSSVREIARRTGLAKSTVQIILAEGDKPG